MPNSIFTSSIKVQPRIGPRRFVYSGIPTSSKQSNMRYSVLVDKKGDKEFRIQLAPKGALLRWKLSPDKEGKGAKAERMPEIPIGQPPDEDDGEIESQGMFQVHKSGKDEIYGTLQDGKTNQSIRFTRGQDGQGWDMQPAQSPKARNKSALDFVTGMKLKTAAPIAPVTEEPYNLQPATHVPTNQDAYDYQRRAVNTMTWPLTGDNLPLQMALTGGIGALGGAAYHGYKKLRNMVTGEEDDDSTVGGDMARFGLAGAAAPVAWNALNSLAGAYQSGLRKVPGIQKNNSLNKKAYEYSSSAQYDDSPNGLDFRQVLSSLRSDTSLTPAEREQLINMAHKASAQGLRVDPQALSAAGMGMLAGYVMSKLMGMGGFGQAAMSGLGGLVGYQMGKSPESRVYSRTGYTYE